MAERGISASWNTRRPVSSASVTLTFARLSPSHQPQAAALATGAVAASTILFARVAVAVTVLDATVLPVLVRYLAAPFVVSLLMLALAWRSLHRDDVEPSTLKNPLQLRSAVRGVLSSSCFYA